MSGTLIINAGSSSVKFAVYDQQNCVCRGLIEDINGANPQITAKNQTGEILLKQKQDPKGFDHTAALAFLFHWLDQQALPKIVIAGHRIVHGGRHYAAPIVITDEVLADLKKIIPLAPLHQPHNIAGIEAIKNARPTLKQVACFDTGFHQTQAELATLIAIPQQYREEGVRRYGLHGLSYEYINQKIPDYFPNGNRFIVCHLGNGASLCAIENRQSIATTMGFSALDGLIMGTRPGLTDPGVLLYLMTQHQLNAEQITDILYKQSGLLAISGRSNDMRDLQTNPDERSELAINAFCYRIVREIGSLMAALQGLDGIVFTGGIGENDTIVREKVLTRLAWLGIKFDTQRNQQRGEIKLSTEDSQIPVWVIPTDEEGVINQHARAFITAE